MINTNKVRLFEEFAAGEISNPEQNVAPAGNVNSTSIPVDKTKIEASGEQVRAEIIKDVDAILTNLETLSKRISENIDKDFFFEGPINESLEGIIGFVKQQANWAKGMALINGDWKKLKLEGNSDIIAGKEHDALAKIEASIDKMKRARDEATGPKKDAIQQKAIATIAKLKDNKADISSKFEEAKEAAAQALEDVEEKLKKYEENMPGGTEGDLYFNTKRKIGNGIKMDGLKEKARVAKEKGKADAAKEAADELKKIGVRSKEADEAIKELSRDVDPKLEEQIKKIQTEIDREKDEDLAAIQSTIDDLKKSLSDDDKIKSDPKLKKETEAKLENAKAQEDETLEGIYYLEDYLEELKAQRAALKGEEYDKAESKVGSTEDGEGKEKEGLGVMGDEKGEEEKPKSDAVKKAEDKVAAAQKEVDKDEKELKAIPKKIQKVEKDLKKAEEILTKANPPKKKKEEVEEAKSSGQEAALKTAQDEVEELKKKKKILQDREKELKSEELPQDYDNLEKAEDELEDAKFDDIKKTQKDKLKSTKESKELTWDTLKEDLGLNQKVEKVHESFSIADKMRLILKR